MRRWRACSPTRPAPPSSRPPARPASSRRAWCPPTFFPAGAPQALSYYDTTPLRETLETLVDFDLLNAGRIRISVGAVDVRSGNFAYFDSAERRLDVRHIMASGALPPGFPPVEIDGEFFWDGGLVSNTPLQYVMDVAGLNHDATIFQVDLFAARGPMPRTLYEAAGREKDIRYSSRTRLNTDVAKENQQHRVALRHLLAKLPDHLHDDPDVRHLRALSGNAPAIALAHLIYRNRNYETQAKDYLFSRQAILDHWVSGRLDVEEDAEPSGLAEPQPRAGRRGLRPDRRRGVKITGRPYRTIWPLGDDAVEVIDQTKLPHEFKTLVLRSAEDAAQAIRAMIVRGAPLIGATAAYGLALAMRADASDEALDRAHDMLAETRPHRDQSALGAGADVRPVAQPPARRTRRAGLERGGGDLRRRRGDLPRHRDARIANPTRSGGAEARRDAQRADPLQRRLARPASIGARRWRRSTWRTTRGSRSMSGSTRPGRATRAPR